MIPDEIRSASQRSRTVAAPVTFEQAVGVPGEISTARPLDHINEGSGGRLVLVIAADEVSRTVTVQLVTNEVEQATDLDLIVSSGDAGPPFAMVVQSELYGPIYIDQLAGVIGRLDDGRLQAITHALMTDGESLDGLSTGVVLGALDDPRRAFKSQELSELVTLIEDSRGWLAGAAAVDCVLDPKLFVPPAAGTAMDDAEDQFLELLDAVDSLGSGLIELPSEFLADNDDLLDELLRWRSDFGLDASRVLTRLCITEIAEVSPTLAERDVAATGPLESYLAACASAGRMTVDVHSMPRCRRDLDELVVVMHGSRTCRGRFRIAEAA